MMLVGQAPLETYGGVLPRCFLASGGLVAIFGVPWYNFSFCRYLFVTISQSLCMSLSSHDCLMSTPIILD